MNIDLDVLKIIVADSISLRAVLIKLDRKLCGGNFQTLKTWILKYSIDTSHFKGKGYLSGKSHSFSNARPLIKILVKGKIENTFRLRKRLITAGLKKEECESCGLKEWMDDKIPLELHHVDGDKRNNCLNNLLIVCPNCHAKTSNYRSKNRRHGRPIGRSHHT